MPRNLSALQMKSQVKLRC